MQIDDNRSLSDQFCSQSFETRQRNTYLIYDMYRQQFIVELDINCFPFYFNNPKNLMFFINILIKIFINFHYCQIEYDEYGLGLTIKSNKKKVIMYQGWIQCLDFKGVTRSQISSSLLIGPDVPNMFAALPLCIVIERLCIDGYCVARFSQVFS